eukprot:4870957-Pleurochrysis_carterae.AAC.1
MLGARAACVTSGKAVWLSRCQGNSDTSDAPLQIAIPLLCRPHLLRYRLVLSSTAGARQEICLLSFGGRYRVSAVGRGAPGLFWRAASAGPTRLLPVELAPSWARGFHCQRPLPDFNDGK